MNSPAGWIARHARFVPHKTALSCADKTLSYAELAARVATTSRWLREDCRLAPGERVAWLGHNTCDLVILLLACAQAQTVFLPLNWRLTREEMTAILDDADCAMLVVHESCAELAPGDGRRLEIAAGYDVPGLGQQAALSADGELVDSEAPPDTPLLLVYTSGTTGTPKGAVHTRESVLFNALNAVHMHDFGARDRVLTVLPMFHVGGLNIQTLPALYCGAEVRLEPRFDPDATLDAIDAWQPTLMVLVPATISALTASPRWPQTDLSSLRCVTTGSTDVPAAVISALHERGVPVIQIYGSTETGPIAIYQRIDDARDTRGSIGRAGLHSEIRLVDADGNDLPDGEPGEILVRGRHVAAGYWRRDDGGIAAFADGWFASGDVASRDAHGLYWFRDRIKHVIISGGENIYPAEIERILGECDFLREAAVAGRPDPRWGEIPVVVAVARGEAGREQVLAALDGRLARYKLPRDVVFVDALPRNVMGKVDLAAIRAIVAA